MRNWIAIILLIPVCLITILSGREESKATNITTEHTEEFIATTIEPSIDGPTVGVTEEPTIATEEQSEPMDIETEPVVTNPTTIEPPATEPPATEPPATEQEQHGGGMISLGIFNLTAYCGCQKCCGEYALNRPIDENGKEIVYGSIGVRLEAGVSISVDPKVIPYGTQVVINGHTYIAHDTGGSIKGNRIDVYFDNHQDALNFGRKNAEVFIYVQPG